MSAHTSLPWRFKPDGGQLNRVRVLGPVHPVDGGDYAPLASIKDPADAELIVRAVNSHAELLAALRATLTQLDSLCEWATHNNWDFCDARTTSSYTAARAAIAKAEGRA